jgi:signal transduction histidine kinase
MVHGGEVRPVARAVGNLLRNVLVHTPGRTVGTITASADGGHVTIEVGDDGPGVAPDELPHIFERFYRAGVPSRRPVPVSGSPSPPRSHPRTAGPRTPNRSPRAASRSR